MFSLRVTSPSVYYGSLYPGHRAVYLAFSVLLTFMPRILLKNEGGSLLTQQRGAAGDLGSHMLSARCTGTTRRSSHAPPLCRPGQSAGGRHTALAPCTALQPATPTCERQNATWPFCDITLGFGMKSEDGQTPVVSPDLQYLKHSAMDPAIKLPLWIGEEIAGGEKKGGYLTRRLAPHTAEGAVHCSRSLLATSP